MKKIYFILLVIFGSFSLNAQPWALPGATWYYDINPNDGSATGYVKITKTGDTLIQSHLCDILEKRAIGYSFWQFQYFNLLYGYEYTYAQNNIVYHWRNNSFFTLYDFNALAGNGWTVAACQFGVGSACGDSGSVSVTQTGTVNINGQNLQYLNMVTDSGSMYGFSDMNSNASTIIQRIGNTLSFIADFSGGCIVDANEMYGLRCYSDSSGFFYDTGLAPACDNITGVDEYSFLHNYIISPNPVRDFLKIIVTSISLSPLEISLYNPSGSQIYFSKEKAAAGKFEKEINIRNFCNGIYFLQVKTNDGVLNKKVLVGH